MNTQISTAPVIEEAQARTEVFRGLCAVDKPVTLLNGHVSFDFDMGDGRAHVYDEAKVCVVYPDTQSQLLISEVRHELPHMLRYGSLVDARSWATATHPMPSIDSAAQKLT